MHERRHVPRFSHLDATIPEKHRHQENSKQVKSGCEIDHTSTLGNYCSILLLSPMTHPIARNGVIWAVKT